MFTGAERTYLPPFYGTSLLKKRTPASAGLLCTRSLPSAAHKIVGNERALPCNKAGWERGPPHCCSPFPNGSFVHACMPPLCAERESFLPLLIVIAAVSSDDCCCRCRSVSGGGEGGGGGAKRPPPTRTNGAGRGFGVRKGGGGGGGSKHSGTREGRGRRRTRGRKSEGGQKWHIFSLGKEACLGVLVIVHYYGKLAIRNLKRLPLEKRCAFLPSRAMQKKGENISMMPKRA